jgi:hypothetical protein
MDGKWRSYNSGQSVVRVFNNYLESHYWTITLIITLPDDLKDSIFERGLFEWGTRDDSPSYVERWAIEDNSQENTAIEMDSWMASSLSKTAHPA